MNKNLTITSVLGILAIFLGAFGAHALKEILTIDGLQSFETAVRYQMYHVLVLLVVNTYTNFTTKQKNSISYLIFIGILFFSGSIYVMQLANIPAKMIWFLTPLGGLFFIVGWIIMLLSFLKKKSTINS
jgi:uncharacterized membrane protein YgdD (TMEM256/DUF423 family)